MCDPRMCGNPKYYGMGTSKPAVRKKLGMEISPAHPAIHFALGPLLRHLPPHAMTFMDSKLLQGAVALRNESADNEIWPLVEQFGLTREAVDAAVLALLPGFIFGSNPKRYSADPEPEQRFFAFLEQSNRSQDTDGHPLSYCSDPALALGVLARVDGGFYQAGRTPDYSIGHLMETEFICSDPRIPAHPALAGMEV